MDFWNIRWSFEIVYTSFGGPVWTAGTSAEVVESSIKVLQDRFGLLEHQLELWNCL